MYPIAVKFAGQIIFMVVKKLGEELRLVLTWACIGSQEIKLVPNFQATCMYKVYLEIHKKIPLAFIYSIWALLRARTLPEGDTRYRPYSYL